MYSILRDWVVNASKSPSADDWSEIRERLDNMTTHDLILLYCFVAHKDYTINKEIYNNTSKDFVSRRWANLRNMLLPIYDQTAFKEKAPGFDVITTIHPLEHYYNIFSKFNGLFI